jgi:hypothetical protein
MRKAIIALAAGLSVAAMTGCTQSHGEGGKGGRSKEAAMPPAAAPPVEFDARFYEEGSSIRPARDGGFIVAGKTSSKGAGSSDVWLIMLDANGQVVWEKTYGGPGSEDAGAVVQLEDGGIVVAATREVKGEPEEEDGWIFKVDRSGNLLWDKRFGGDRYDRIHAVAESGDGGVVAVGGTASKGAGALDGWAIRLDKDGAVAWERTYGGEGRDELLSVQAAKGGGFVAAGTKARKGSVNEDGWVVMLGSDGEVRWETTAGGDRWERLVRVRQTGDGGVIAAGESQSNAEQLSNLWLLKLGPEGAVQWDKQFGGPNDDRAASLVEKKDGGFVVCGTASRKLSEEEAIVERNPWGVSKNYLSSDLWVMDLGPAGDLRWEQKYGGNNEGCADITAAPRGYVLTGWTGSKAKRKTDLWVIAIDEIGGPVWDRVLGD